MPFLFFAFTGAIPRAGLPRMLLLFALGGLQGFVGWWMVESGLETRVSVSQYRLAIHLGVAIILLGAIFWTAFEYLRANAPSASCTRAKKNSGQRLPPHRLLYLQILLGALVAGLHAGLIYNTWPSMDGRVFPEHPFFASPWWINFFENPGLAQFDHRIGAYIIALAVTGLWFAEHRAKLKGPATGSGNTLLAVMLSPGSSRYPDVGQQVPVALPRSTRRQR